jgi:hypothetical protein
MYSIYRDGHRRDRGAKGMSTWVSTMSLALVMEGRVPIKRMQSSFGGTLAMMHLDMSRISSVADEQDRKAEEGVTDSGWKNPSRGVLLCRLGEELFLPQCRVALELVELHQDWGH